MINDCLLCGMRGHDTIHCPWPPEDAAHKMAARIEAEVRLSWLPDVLLHRRLRAGQEPHTDQQIAALSDADLRRYVRAYQNRRNRRIAAAKTGGSHDLNSLDATDS